MPNVFTTEWLSAQAYLMGWKIVGRLPLPLTAALCTRAADYASDDGKGMNQLRKNLSRVVGPENVTRTLVRDAMRSYARYWLEAFRLPQIAGDPGVVKRIDDRLVGKTHLDAAVAAPTGTILVLPHSGNWDMAGMYFAATYGTFTTVAERLKPEILFDAFVDFRTTLGFRVIPHIPAPGSPPVMEQLADVLTAGGTICLLGDRDLKGTGVSVTFFGEETTMPTGAVKLDTKDLPDGEYTVAAVDEKGDLVGGVDMKLGDIKNAAVSDGDEESDDEIVAAQVGMMGAAD
ncbi:MAG: phosphatidylinositol mannoside acyltransferase, partial [Corynebacterium matruchotii]